MKCAVVIPTHKPEFDHSDLVSIRRGQEILLGKEGVDMHFVLPERNRGLHNFEGITNHYLDDENFKSEPAYNRMMKSPYIYELFEDYEFMLIYQTDAFILKDELEWWMEQDYDYIGAAWVNLYGGGQFINAPYNHFVGNGGLNLRRIRPMIDMTRKIMGRRERGKPNNEDRYFSWVCQERYGLNKPQIFKALRFSFGVMPEKAYALNGNNLPFGCHAWSNPEKIDFWRPFFKEIGYDI